MGGPFFLDNTGLTPLSDIHAQVSDGLSRLLGDGAPRTSDVARSFGNIASGVNDALDGLTQSRGRTIQTTKGAGDTISELLAKAHQMYLQGDQKGADELKAAADALEASEGGSGGRAGQANGASAGATGAAGGAAGGGGGAEMVSQIGQQVGQQVSQIAQGLAGSLQGLSQLPQQLVQGLAQVTGMGSGAGAGGAHDPAKAHEEKDGDREARERKEAEKRAEEQREQRDRRHAPPAPADGAQPGRTSDGGRAPVPPSPAERPRPAPTLPQPSNL